MKMMDTEPVITIKGLSLEGKGRTGFQPSYVADLTNLVVKVSPSATVSQKTEPGRISFGVLKNRTGTYGIRILTSGGENKDETVRVYPRVITVAEAKRSRRKGKERYILDDNNFLEREAIENRKEELLSVIRAF